MIAVGAGMMAVATGGAGGMTVVGAEASEGRGGSSAGSGARGSGTVGGPEGKAIGRLSRLWDEESRNVMPYCRAHRAIRFTEMRSGRHQASDGNEPMRVLGTTDK